MAKRYRSFSKYLEGEYYNEIAGELELYIADNGRGLNLYSCSVPDPQEIELNDFRVMSVNFRDTDSSQLIFTASIRAEIDIPGCESEDYENRRLERWFSVSFTATLRNGLRNVEIQRVCEYTKERFNAEDALSRYLVPYIHTGSLEKHAEKFLRKYCPEALERPMALPIPDVLSKMKLSVLFAPLPAGVFGQTYFKDAAVDVFEDERCREVVNVRIDAGTILVSPDCCFMRNVGSVNNTIVHECVHWDKHGKFFELQKLLNPEITSLSCAVVDGDKRVSAELSEELKWMEWQANALAPRIMIPARTGRAKLNEILRRLNEEMPGCGGVVIMELAVNEFAEFFHVSMTAAKIRAVELGFEQAVGVFNYVNGRQCPTYSFAPGSLKSGQTFVVDRSNAIFESMLNPDLAEVIRDGLFIHAGGMFVINDPKYVDTREGKEAALTPYALGHIDECCLVFNLTTSLSAEYDESFYRVCFLCRDADSKNYVEAKYNPYEEQNQDVRQRAREMKIISGEAQRLSKIAESLPSSFSGTLNAHIKRKRLTNEKLEERSHISARTIQDYRNKADAKPTLQSVLALCIGLNLHSAFFYDLIAKAGYNIMNINEEFMMYRYLIDNHYMETIDRWNDLLSDTDFKQKLP